jgi:hypothetical protein
METGIFYETDEDENLIEYTVQTITSLNTLYQRQIDPYELVGISVYRELSRRRMINQIRQTIRLEQTLNMVSDYFTRRTLEIIGDFSIEENLRRELHDMLFQMDEAVCPIQYPNDTVLGEDTECSICFEQIEAGENIYDIPCNHIFHKECMTKWIDRRKKSCPLCRRCIHNA